MRASVDHDLCIGCGVCEAECPEVFEMGDEGLAVAKEGDIDKAFLEKAQEARNQCPVEAITIE